VGKYEAQSFANNKPESSLQILKKNLKKFVGLDANDLKSIQKVLRQVDNTPNYSKIGGAAAYAITIASVDSAAKALGVPMFKLISQRRRLLNYIRKTDSVRYSKLIADLSLRK